MRDISIIVTALLVCFTSAQRYDIDFAEVEILSDDDYVMVLTASTLFNQVYKVKCHKNLMILIEYLRFSLSAEYDAP